MIALGMKRYGAFNEVSDLHRGAVCSVFAAAPAGEAKPTGETKHVVKVCDPPAEIVGEEARKRLIGEFLASMELQRGVSGRGASESGHWARVLETGRGEDGAGFAVMERATRGSLERLIAGAATIHGAALSNIAGSIVAGLRELRGAAGRGHGNLRYSNVLFMDDRPPAENRVALTDPAPQPGSRGTDLHAIGRMIYALVMRREHGGGWPLAASPIWDELGPTGSGWRELANRLLDPSLTGETGGRGVVPDLDEIAEEIAGLTAGGGGARAARPRKRGVMIAAAAAGALVCAGGVWYFGIRGPRGGSGGTDEQALGSTRMWEQDAEARTRWERVCDDYYNWVWALVRVDRAPSAVATIASGVAPATRRDLYQATCPELLEKLNMLGEGGEHPGTIADVKDREPDFRVLRNAPTAPARSDAGVPRTARLVERVSELRKYLAEEWPGVRVLRESAAEFEAAGWSNAAARAKALQQRLMGAVGRSDGSAGSAVAEGGVVAVCDEIAAALPELKGIKESMAKIRECEQTLRGTGDRVLTGFVERSDALIAAELGGGAVGASGDEFATLGRASAKVAAMGKRLVAFVEGPWRSIDAEELFRSEEYRELADRGARSVSDYDAWVAMAERYPALPPEENPAPAVARAMEGLRARVAEHERVVASARPLDASAAAKIDALTRRAGELARLGWVKKNRERIEAESAALLREINSATAVLDSAIGDFRRDAARSREELLAQIRGEKSIVADSEAINAEWRRRRDRLLESQGAGDKESLAQSVRSVKAGLTALNGKFRPAPEGAAGDAPWAVGFINAVVAERERRITGAIERLGGGGVETEAAIAQATGTAAAEFSDWLTSAESLLADLRRMNRMLQEGADLSGSGSGAGGGEGESALAIWERSVQSPVLRDPALGEAVQPLRDLVQSVRGVQGESDPAALTAAIARAGDGESAVALAAWRGLGRKELEWPRKEDDPVEAGRAVGRVEDVLGRTAMTAARREELRAQVRAEAADRWNRYAERWLSAESGDSAARRRGLEQARAAMESFGVGLEAVSNPRVRYNMLVLRLVSELRPAADAESAAAVRRFAEQAAQLPVEVKDRSEVAALLAALAPLAVPPPDEPPPPEPTAFGPGSRGLVGRMEDEGRAVVFDLSGTPLRFVRVDGAGGGAEVAYLCEDEASLDVFVRLVARTSGRWSKFRELLNVAEDDEGWFGPRGWIWPAGGAMKDGDFWIDAQSPYQTGDPAYEPSLSAEPPRTGSGRRLKPEFGGKPTMAHPMHGLTPAAAIEAAGAIGCRLPTVEEWRAAYQAFGASVSLASWNLRDATFQKQYDYAAGVQRSRASSPTYIDYYALPDRFSYAPGAMGAASLSFDDRTLWFRPVGTGPGPLYNLVGNVGELVLTGGADASSATVGVIGASSLSDISLTPETVKPLERRTDKFVDVGMRLAFSAPAGKPRPKPIAERATAALGDQPLLMDANP